jgi:hypothetical protein
MAGSHTPVAAYLLREESHAVGITALRIGNPHLDPPATLRSSSLSESHFISFHPPCRHKSPLAVKIGRQDVQVLGNDPKGTCSV